MSDASGATSGVSAMGRFLANLREMPKTFRESLVRGGPPTTDRTRSSFVFGNVFLHLHAVRTHRWSLRWSTTAGLGIMSVAAFLITLITGVLLMFYYKPYPDAGPTTRSRTSTSSCPRAASSATSTAGRRT